MSEDSLRVRVCVLEGRVNAALILIADLRATIEEERSNPCQCSHSSSPSASATSSSSAEATARAIEFGQAYADKAAQESHAEALKRGVRNGLKWAEAGGGMWLSREEILALLGEPA